MVVRFHRGRTSDTARRHCAFRLNTHVCVYIALTISLIFMINRNIAFHQSASSIVSNYHMDHLSYSSSTQRQSKKSLSIVVVLEGGFGNHLSKIAMGKMIQSMARQHGFSNTSLHIMSQSENLKNWDYFSEAIRTRYRKDCKRCFPNLRNMMFLEGNEERFQEYSRRHDVALGPERASYVNIDRTWCRQLDCRVDPIEKALETVQTIWQSGELNLQSGRWNSTFNKEGVVLGPYSFPMIISQQFPDWHMFGKFYDDTFVDFFQVDEECYSKTRAYPDEVVFYYRHFLESQNRSNVFRPWYDNMSFDSISKQLLGHMKSGDRLAIVTEQPRARVKPLIQIMRKRNVTVRVICNKDWIIDFFFLLSAQRELIGRGESTFYQLATLLNKNVKKARVYFFDNGHELKSRFLPDDFPPIIESQDLRERLQFELYKK